MFLDDAMKEAIFITFYFRRFCKSLENLQELVQEIGESEKRLPIYDDDDWWFPFRRRNV